MNQPAAKPPNRRIPFSVLGISTALAIVITALALIFVNPPQCPSYTTAQGNSCIIGANIGLGLCLLAAVAVWILGIVAAALCAVRNVLVNKQLSGSSRLVRVVAFTLGTIIVIYVSLGLYFEYIHVLIRSL